MEFWKELIFEIFDNFQGTFGSIIWEYILEIQKGLRKSVKMKAPNSL